MSLQTVLLKRCLWWQRLDKSKQKPLGKHIQNKEMLSNPFNHTNLRISVSEDVCPLSGLESAYCKMYICIVINMHIVTYNIHIILFGILLVFITHHTSNYKTIFRLYILTCTCLTSWYSFKSSSVNLLPRKAIKHQMTIALRIAMVGLFGAWNVKVKNNSNSWLK